MSCISSKLPLCLRFALDSGRAFSVNIPPKILILNPLKHHHHHHHLHVRNIKLPTNKPSDRQK